MGYPMNGAVIIGPSVHVCASIHISGVSCEMPDLYAVDTWSQLTTTTYPPGHTYLHMDIAILDRLHIPPSLSHYHIFGQGVHVHEQKQVWMLALSKALYVSGSDERLLKD